ncbi:MAG: hypothetical protein ACI9KS_000216 [Sulfitobacter sp.]|jgi:hypothetical protein
MPKYNRTFDLTLNDVEQIETALRSRKHILSERRLALLNSEAVAETAEIDSELVEIADLLGRLHNQKIFYRPETTDNVPYVSG